METEWAAQYEGLITKVYPVNDDGSYSVEVDPEVRFTPFGLRMGWHWYIEMPVIEYTPKLGDAMIIEVSTWQHPLYTVRFKIKNGPWVTCEGASGKLFRLEESIR